MHQLKTSTYRNHICLNVTWYVYPSCLRRTSTNHVLKYMCLCFVFNFQEKTKKQLLYEISICLTKEFELISCNKKEVSETTCPRNEPFFYPPVHDDFPQIDISVIWLAYLPFVFIAAWRSDHFLPVIAAGILCTYHWNNTYNCSSVPSFFIFWN